MAYGPLIWLTCLLERGGNNRAFTIEIVRPKEKSPRPSIAKGTSKTELVYTYPFFEDFIRHSSFAFELLNCVLNSFVLFLGGRIWI